MPLRIAIIVVWMCASALAEVPADKTDQLAPTVQRAIEQLDSLVAAERMAALKDLQSLGAKALPALPEDLSPFTPTTRDTLARLRNQWERELATASLQPSEFQLTKSTATSLSSLAAAIQSETANILVLDHTLSVERLPQVEGLFNFWNGVGYLETLTESRCRWNPDLNRFVFTPVEIVQPIPSDTAGAARALLESTRLRPLPTEEKSQLMRAELRLQIEPRLRPLFVRVVMQDWSAATATHSLSPWNPPAVLELPFPDGGSEVVFPVDLIWPDTATVPWSLTGIATVHYTARWATVAFAAQDLAPGTLKRRGGVSVRLRQYEFQSAGQNLQRARIRIVVNYDHGGPAFESHRAGLFHRSARMIDRKENEFLAESFDVIAEADGSMILEYVFDELPGQPLDYRFEYAAPTQLLDVAYPLRFRDLPAPSLGID